MASYQIKKAKQITLNDPASQQDKKYLFETATSLFNAADKIDIRETTSWIGKGIYPNTNLNMKLNLYN